MANAQTAMMLTAVVIIFFSLSELMFMPISTSLEFPTVMLPDNANLCADTINTSDPANHA